MITLKTLPQATEQEIFDQVAVHLLTQKQKSEDSDHCTYRKDNLKCAAGCLISDEEYNPIMDDNKKLQDKYGSGTYTSWDDLANIGLVPKEHSIFVRELQIIHDKYIVDSWKNYLIGFAQTNNLNTKAIDNL